MGLSLSAFLVSLTLSSLFPDQFREWELKTIDYRFKLRLWGKGNEEINYDIVHIDIDDDSIHDIGRWQKYGKVVDALSRYGVDKIMYDVIFGVPGEDVENLIRVTRKAGNVYYPVGFRLSEGYSTGFFFEKTADEDKIRTLERLGYNLKSRGKGQPFVAVDMVAPVTELMKAARGVGHICAVEDIDGVHRRTPLLVAFKGRLFPSFALGVLCDHMEVKPEDMELHFGQALILHNALLPDSGTRKTLSIPIDERGQMIINYAGRWDDSFYHYAYSDVVDADEQKRRELREELKGKICIVGVTATGTSEIGITPLETNFPSSGLHSNILNTILTENFIREVPPKLNGVVALLLALTVAVLSALLRRPLRFSISSLFLLMLYPVIGLASFSRFGLLLGMIFPFWTGGLCFIFVILYRYLSEERERMKLKQAFGRYVSPQVLEEALEGSRLALDMADRKELTVLFSDMVGFTPFSEQLHPDDLRELLNEYFEQMTAIIFKYEGTVDKFIGDGLMAFFGEPGSYDDHALRAVKAAVEMQEKVKQLRSRWLDQGKYLQHKYPLQIRVGINTGRVALGNIGSRQRMDYTVIGTNVSLAAKLQSQGVPGRIWMGQRTYALIKKEIEATPLGEKKVSKGKEVLVYEINCDE